LISIIVPVYNDEKKISRFLASFSKMKNHFELLVVDGSSQDHTGDLAMTFENEHIFFYQSPSRGHCFQMNFGAEKAKGELLLFVSIDSQLPSDIDLDKLEKDFYQEKIILAAFENKEGRKMPNLKDGLLIDKNDFLSAGQFKALPKDEDTEFVQRLHRLGRIAVI
jgi:glycosyltransferase involved in cell wall biosynthesis